MRLEDLKFIKKVYDRMFQGTYDPEQVKIAYEMITKNSGPVKFSIKKNTLYAFMNYQYSSIMAQHESKVEKAIAVSAATISEVVETTPEINISDVIATVINEKVETKKTKGRTKILQSQKKKTNRRKR